MQTTSSWSHHTLHLTVASMRWIVKRLFKLEFASNTVWGRLSYRALIDNTRWTSARAAACNCLMLCADGGDDLSALPPEDVTHVSVSDAPPSEEPPTVDGESGQSKSYVMLLKNCFLCLNDFPNDLWFCHICCWNVIINVNVISYFHVTARA